MALLSCSLREERPPVGKAFSIGGVRLSQGSMLRCTMVKSTRSTTNCKGDLLRRNKFSCPHSRSGSTAKGLQL